MSELGSVLGQLAQTTTDPMFVVDREFRYRWANLAYGRVWGLACGDLAGRSVSGTVGVETFETVLRPAYDRCFAGEATRAEAWVETPVAGRRYFRATYLPLRGPSGEALFIGGILHDLTDHRLAVERNERQRAELEAILDSMADCLVVWGPDGKMVRANRATLELCGGWDPMGLDLEEVNRRFSTAWLDGRPLERQELPTPRALSGQPVRGAQFRIVRADGKPGVLETNATPIVLEGRIVGAVAVWRDLSERQELAAEVASQAVRLRAVLETTHAQIALLDRDMRFVIANSAYVAGCGHPLEELLGRNHFDLFPNAENEVIFARVRDTGHPHAVFGKPFEFAGHPERGTTYWDWTLNPIKDADGRVAGVLLSLLDVTHQELARQRTEALAEMMAELNAGADVSIVMSTALGRFTQLLRGDDAALFLFEPDGRHLRGAQELLPFGRVGRILDSHDLPSSLRAIETNEPVRVAAPGATPDEAVWAERTGMPVSLHVPLATGKRRLGVLYVNFRSSDRVVQSEDLTFARRLGQQIALALDRAQLQERERSSYIAALQASEERSRQVSEANRLKSEFLASMSHELRTPLNAILGFTELIHDGHAGPVTPRQQEYLADVLSSSRHLLGLINDVLDLAKIEAGKMTFLPEDVDLAGLAQKVVGLHREAASRKLLELRLEVEQALGTACLDPQRLEQVLHNFLSNAVKFTQEGGCVTVRLRSEGSGHFRMEVEDSGEGIPAADLGSLFEEFTQLGAGLARKHSGTGLGLALTRRMVEGQGGYVGVCSTPGVRSLFFAVMPRGSPGISAGLERSAAPLFSPGKAAPRVLLLSSDSAERARLLRDLTIRGFGVQAAPDGRNATELLRLVCHDVVLIDLGPRDDPAAQLLQRLAATEKATLPPVVVLASGELASSARHLAVAAVLVRPVTEHEVVLALSTVLQRHNPSKPVA